MRKLILMACFCVLSSAIVMAEEVQEKECGDKAPKCKPCDKGGREKGEKAEVSAIPAAVSEAAVKEVEGFAVSEAQMMKKDDKTVYRLFGKVGDKDYCVVVDSEGNVLKSFEKGKGRCGAKKEGWKKEHEEKSEE